MTEFNEKEEPKSRQDPLVCPRCHGVKDPDAKLCDTCMAKIEEHIEEQEAAATQHPVALSRRDLIVTWALLLAIMAGGLVYLYIVVGQICYEFSGYSSVNSDNLLYGFLKVGGVLGGEGVMVGLMASALKSYRRGQKERKTAKA